MTRMCDGKNNKEGGAVGRILKESRHAVPDSEKAGANLPDALEMHLQRMKRMAEQDRKVLELAGKRMDVGAPS